jgi:hypothetical protein
VFCCVRLHFVLYKFTFRSVRSGFVVVLYYVLFCCAVLCSVVLDCILCCTRLHCVPCARRLLLYYVVLCCVVLC